MFRRKRIALQDALQAMDAYERIPIRFSEIELAPALEVADDLGIYAYDAYIIVCALRHRCPILSLDEGLLRAAKTAGAAIVEVHP